MRKSNIALVANDKSYAQGCKPEAYDGPHRKDYSEEIIDLHQDILRTAVSLLPKVFRIGELLVIQKQRLPHGQFTTWIKENLPFCNRTAQNYMRVFRHKEEIKNEEISVLGDAYNLVKSRRIKSNTAGKNEDERSFLHLSLYPEEREWIDEALKKAKEVLETDSNSRAIQLIFYDWFMFVADNTELIPIRDAKKVFEKIYNVKITINKK